MKWLGVNLLGRAILSRLTSSWTFLFSKCRLVLARRMAMEAGRLSRYSISHVLRP